MKKNRKLKQISSFARGATVLITSACLGLIAVTALATFAFSSRAEACRDCPFPMKTGDNHWLMPNGQIEVIIVQKDLHDGMIETRIELHAAKTGELLASGVVITPKGQSSVTTQLADPKGNQVQFELDWYDDRHDRVQIDIHCVSNSCAIDGFRI